MKSAGIIGASGYAGFELIKILLNHQKVELKVLNSKNHSGKPVKDLYPESESDLKFTGYSFNEINKMDLDCLFLALPDRVS
ncbi:N-acetyl-gamma-glutamyl-phosphate reductase, partial [Candidatus Woesearchaeota archaeon]|nr:N-acetyl-gamma-glutamyl-phosphate reductase [Candidatus Woesearchaeota archaeon]